MQLKNGCDMPLFTYRYRFIHAVTEKVTNFAASILAPSTPKDLGRPPKRVLVLKFGGLGEAVLARSLMNILRERNPSMTFDLLVEGRTIEVMSSGSHGTVYRYSPSHDGIWKALKQLLKIRRSKYDAVLDFEQESLLTAGFARATGIPVRVGFIPARTSHRGRMFTHAIQLREDESMWTSFLKVGRILDQDLPDDPQVPSLWSARTSNEWADRWCSEQIGKMDTPLVALHLGVGPSADYRRWPVERFVELAAVLAAEHPAVTILLTGSASERTLIREFQGKFAGRSIDASAAGSLHNTVSLLRKCDLVVSGDTGVMHLAAGLGVPTVGLFGPNTPACWAPVGVRATYVYSPKLPCSPCINTYERHIPVACTAARSGDCMWQISVSSVLDAAASVAQGDWIRRFEPQLNILTTIGSPSSLSSAVL